MNVPTRPNAHNEYNLSERIRPSKSSQQLRGQRAQTENSFNMPMLPISTDLKATRKLKNLSSL